jgi:hypothetical protein
LQESFSDQMDVSPDKLEPARGERSKRIRDQPLHCVSVGPSRTKLNTADESHEVFRMGGELHGTDPFGIHDNRAVYADEAGGIEAFFDGRHRRLDQVASPTHM